VYGEDFRRTTPVDRAFAPSAGRLRRELLGTRGAVSYVDPDGNVHRLGSPLKK
jgi:hypothetical protein